MAKLEIFIDKEKIDKIKQRQNKIKSISTSVPISCVCPNCENRFDTVIIIKANRTYSGVIDNTFCPEWGEQIMLRII